MAKKIVRGITDIKTINNQDLDTNNVNDLLSDGEHNYIHRKKKDGSEEYHNLTNNIKTIEAVSNGLLSVTNYNNTKNSAKLEVHHDQAKSQLLYSPDQTINVQNGENGSAELTTVDVNFEKVQTKLRNNTSIGVSGTGLQQLYTQSQTYTHTNGILKTHVKSVANSSSVSTLDEEFNFFVRLNKGTITASFTLNEHDTAVFNYIMREHGVNNEFNLNNSILKLNGSTLEYLNNSLGVTYNNFITTFTYIIPSNQTTSNSRVDLPQDTPTIEVDKTDENVEKEQTE